MNQIREKMHAELAQLSTDFLLIEANQSSHFVWVDQPDLISDAVRILLDKLKSSEFSGK